METRSQLRFTRATRVQKRAANTSNGEAPSIEYSSRHLLKAEPENLNVAVAVFVETGLGKGSPSGLTASVSVRLYGRGEKDGGWTMH